jgi:AcrR family transcriptional regulator
MTQRAAGPSGTSSRTPPHVDEASLALTRLRSGRHSLPREQVDGIQRARIIGAMVEVASEQGFLGAAVGRVVKRAGVSRRTFYELFDGRESCFQAAFDWGVQQAGAQMAEAFARERAWRDGVRSALLSLLVFLDSEPQLARVCVVEALGAGTLVLQRRAQVLQQLADALRSGAPRARGSSEPPLLTAETVVGGAFSTIHTRLLLADGPLSELLGQLMALILLPYQGARAAGEELARPLPELPARPAPSARGASTRILERLDMRLTYRTVRCLLFVAEHPDASNREVAQGADIKDEGQASKLLTRLAGMDLLSRSCPGPGKPNAWRLTPHGQQVLQALQST